MTPNKTRAERSHYRQCYDPYACHWDEGYDAREPEIEKLREDVRVLLGELDRLMDAMDNHARLDSVASIRLMRAKDALQKVRGE